MRRRLVLSYLSVVAAILLLLEIPLGVLTDHHERDLLGSQASEEATGLAVLAGQDLATKQIPGLERLVERYHLEASGDVLILDANGAVVADSDGDGADDVTALRPWIQSAMTGHSVTAQIHENGQPVTLSATPVSDPDGASQPAGVVILSLYASQTLQLIHKVWLALAAFAVLALAVTVLLGLRVARSVTTPLGELQQAVVRLGDGHLTERASPGGPPEVRTLALEFNRMAARMEDLVAAQSRFVADASHQLRSPLTALRLRLENLLLDATGPAAASLSALERELQRLSRLVEGLLALSRADGDRPVRAPVDVAQVIGERVETWEPLAAERGLRLDAVAARLRDPMVALVPGDLDQILDNLLANALDATPAGRAITVAVNESDLGVEVTVSDEGPGMTVAERARAFDRFWQGANRRGGGSSGLGLAIVRQLARRNGGEVDLSAARGASSGDEPSRVVALAVGRRSPRSDGPANGPDGAGEEASGPGLRARVVFPR